MVLWPVAGVQLLTRACHFLTPHILACCPQPTWPCLLRAILCHHVFRERRAFSAVQYTITGFSAPCQLPIVHYIHGDLAGQHPGTHARPSSRRGGHTAAEQIQRVSAGNVTVEKDQGKALAHPI